MRRYLVAATVTCALLLATSCGRDAAGPPRALPGQFAVVPNFGTLQGGIVEIARGRFVLTRIPGGAVAADTVVTIASDADSVALAIQVPVLTPGETFNLTISLITSTGDTVFRGGPIEVSPSTSGTPVPVEVPFAYVGIGAAAAGVQVVSPDTGTFTGESVLLTAVALDSGEVAIPGTPIGWESLDTARVRVTTDAQYRGVAVGGSQRGAARLVATLVTGQTDTVLVRNQPLPTALVAESGSDQSAFADSTLPQPLVARVLAGDGLGVAGLWVRFTVTSGGGTLSADSVLTDSTGWAAASYTLARSFQPSVVTATTARLGSTSATFNATLLFPPPAALEVVTGDGQTAIAGSAVAVPPQVRVLDADSLPVPGVTVVFGVTAGGGIMAGGTPVTDTLGLAAVTSWTLGTLAGANTLTATVGSLTTTFAATALAGPPTTIAADSGSGQTAAVGTTLPQDLIARLTDSGGNAVPGLWVRFLVLSGGGSVSLDSALTDTTGRAATSWTLGPTPGTQTVVASTSPLPASTATFTGTAQPGAAASLAFTVEPTDAALDAAISPAVVVAAYDGFGNVASGFTGSVQVSLLTNPGGATLGGTTTQPAAAGVATFADLALDAFASGYSLLATSAGLTPATSAAFAVLPAGGPGINTWLATSGTWSNDANWSLGRAPIAGDTVQLTQGVDYLVTLDVSSTIAKLSIGGTTDFITLAVGDQTLTITNTGVDPGIDILPLGSIEVGNGAVVAERISNQGAVRFSGANATLGTGTTSNAGTWAVVGGQLTVNGEGAFDFQTSGQLRLENNATLTFDGGGYLTYLGGTIEGGLGTGNLLAFVNGAELNLRADLAYDSLTVGLANGRIQAFSGPERLAIGPDAGLAMNGSVLAEVTAVVENQGVITVNDGFANSFNDSLYTSPGAIVQVNAGAAGTELSTGGWDNAGAIALTGTQPATITIPGARALTNRSGGTITTLGAGAHVLNLTLVNAAGGSVVVSSPLSLQRTAASAQHVNSGTINVTGGSLTVNQNYGAASPRQTFTIEDGGAVILTGGDLIVNQTGANPLFTTIGTLNIQPGRSATFTGAGRFDLVGGDIVGAGTLVAPDTLSADASSALSLAGTLDLSGVVSSTIDGVVDPANNLAGWNTVTGAFPLSPSAEYRAGLGGTSAVSLESDRIDVSGAATLAGTLNASELLNGYAPQSGDRIPIMTFASATGAFGTLTFPNAGTYPEVTGLTFDTVTVDGGVNPDTLYITVASAAPPGPPGTETAWLGTVSTDWSAAQNWFGGNVPDDTTTTFIQAGTPFAPVVAVGATVQTDGLVLDTGASLTVDGTLQVFGDLAAGYTSIGGAGTVTLAGTTGTVSGIVPSLLVDGDYMVTGDLTVTGDLRIQGTDSVLGDPGTNLRLNGNTVVVAGDFVTALFGHLYMQNAADTLAVQGSATFGGDETVTSLTNGVLLVAGDFSQTSSIRSASFHPTGAHTTVLNGTATQTLSFQDQGRLSTFANLEITNPAGVTLTTGIVAVGELRVVPALAIASSNRLAVDGPIVFDPAATLTVPYLEFRSTIGVTAANFTVDTVVVTNTALPDSLPYTTVIVGGSSGTLAGPTTVGGNLLVRSIFNVSGQTLVVDGDLLVADGPSARLRMQSAADSVVVNGNATFNGAAAVASDLSAGVLDLKGDFTQIGTTGPLPAGGNNFLASGTHRTRFSGTGAQVITFSQPDSSVFNDLLITNTTQPVVMLSDAAAVGNVTVPAGATLQADTSGLSAFGSVTADGGLTLAGLGVFGTLNANPATFAVATTIFGGAAGLIPDSLPYDNVAVSASTAFEGNTTLTGVLALSGDPLGDLVELTLGPYTVQVDQLAVQGSATLRMTDPAGVMDVAGSATFAGAATAGMLTAGTLRVGGDLTQLNTVDAGSFAADAGHLTVLDGTDLQTILFATPDTTQSHFGTLRVENASTGGTEFTSNGAVAGALVSPSPAAGAVRRLAASTPGLGLVVLGLDADSLAFDGLTLAVGEGASLTRFDDVRFENQDPAVTQFFLRRKTDAVTFKLLSFLTVPGTGRYLSLEDADGAAPAFTVTMDTPTPAAHEGFAVTDGVAQLLGWPAALPASVLFGADSAGATLNSGIFKVDGDGTNQVQITADGPPGELDVHPRWSPDRSRVTYTNRVLRTGPNALYVRSSDGQQVAVVVSDTSASRPRYSADGTHLAFSCGDGNYPTSDQDVCVIGDITSPGDNLGNGSGKVFVTDAADPQLGGSGAFSWNPQDPNQLAVVRDSVFPGPTPIVGSQIWIVGYDGSGAAPLTTKVLLDGAGRPVQVYAMDWSPDGSFIVVEGVSGSARSLFRIDVASGNVTQLTTLNQDFAPVISPDNTEILFGRQSDLLLLMKVPATGGSVVQMSPNMNFGFDQAGWDWSPDGTEIVVTEDVTTAGVVISKILPSTTATSFFSDATAGKLGRRGGSEIQDRQPSWRP